MSIIEQRANIKFCVLLHKSAAETVLLLNEAYGEASLKKSQVYDWHKRFRDGRESLEDDTRSGRPLTSVNPVNIERVKEIVRSNRRQSIEVIAEQVGISKGSCHTILCDVLNMHRVCQRFIPHALTEEQQEQRANLAQDLIEKADEDPTFLEKIVTGDETWCFLYDPQGKRQSSEWKSPSSPRGCKTRLDRSKGKVMLIVFYDHMGIIHYEFIPEGCNVNKVLYVEILRRLRDAVRRKRPERWARNDWILLDDNARPHRALTVKEYLTKHDITVMEHPPYSPDLAPCDFDLFPIMKRDLKGKRFSSAEEVKAAATEALRRVPKEFFKKSFENLYYRWQACVTAEGKYFEGNIV